MEGVIANYRGSHHTQYNNQMILVIDGVDSKEEAVKLVSKTVVWTSPAGKELKGEIRSSHGNKGAVRVIFETGMPGQSKGTKVKIQ
ncbi:50S ribosomal protein L35ae [Candidatus Woesearchaeota archaeon]|nr:50S ribosomal protein L35ae [Candidatus Woesearchaeota archaeon]